MAAPKKKADQFQPSGDTKRVISCGGGRWVRVGDHNGRWHHLSVERDHDDLWTLVEEVAEANPDLAARIVDELVAVNVEQFEPYRRLLETETEVEA